MLEDVCFGTVFPLEAKDDAKTALMGTLERLQVMAIDDPRLGVME